jgi:photosystem II stability/assembly factor-like uncharacterized protein
VGELGRIIKTTDGGKNWVEILRPTHKNLNSVVIGSTMTVAVGEEGSIFVSYNDGQSWTPHSTGNQSNIFGLTVKDFSALALGSHGTMSITTDNGNVWGTTVHGDQSTTFYSSSFISNTTGWAVGSTSSGNIILHTTNSGVNWTGQIAFTNEPLFGVNFLSPDTGFAVGANGTIIYSSDGGNNWQNQYSGTYESINSISFINSKFGYAVGNNGLLLKGNMGNMTNTDHNSISNSAGIYPNPIKGYDALSIHIPSSYPAEINICNLLGESVLKEVLLADFQNININQLVNGIYMVDIHSKSGHDIKKLVIQR